MTPEEFCKELGGYANANKLVIKHEGKPTYIGAAVDGKYELNELGLKLQAESNALATVGVKKSKKAVPARKKGSATSSEEVASKAQPE